MKLKLVEISTSEDEKLKWADSKLAISAINWIAVLKDERKNLYERLSERITD